MARVVYAIVLIGVAMVAFGARGVLAGGTVLLLWWVCGPRGESRPGCTVALLYLTAMGIYLFPSIEESRDEALVLHCQNKLKQLVLLLQQYGGEEQRLPPLEFDSEGTGHPHSWRVALIPFFFYTSTPGSDYDLTQPWDSEGNKGKWEPSMMQACTCPRHDETGQGAYLAIAGEETVWGAGEERKLSDATDDPAATLLLVEGPQTYVAWNEPRDLSFDEALELLTSPHDETNSPHWRRPGVFFQPCGFRTVAMCDRNVHTLRMPLDRDTATALLTARGGETVDLGALLQPEFERDYRRIVAAWVFALLALLPGAVVGWRRIAGSTADAQVPTGAPLAAEAETPGE